jgi:hypothetical protein
LNGFEVKEKYAEIEKADGAVQCRKMVSCLNRSLMPEPKLQWLIQKCCQYNMTETSWVSFQSLIELCSEVPHLNYLPEHSDQYNQFCGGIAVPVVQIGTLGAFGTLELFPCE